MFQERVEVKSLMKVIITEDPALQAAAISFCSFIRKQKKKKKTSCSIGSIK
jgi:hypothetical protein